MARKGVELSFRLICRLLENCSRRPPFVDDLTGRFVRATETPSQKRHFPIEWGLFTVR